MKRTLRRAGIAMVAGGAACLMLALPSSARASTAYGTLNNFDCVNDTGVEAHGFDIELDDIHCVDITYTYDWNHYGAPKITEDNSDPLHPRVLVRYASGRNPDGTWAAYTAIPAGPISPTDGHQFTNPSINFGGEHYGVGYYGAPTAVRYNWLVDDGTGKLVRGPPVNVSTPTFVYYPPVAAVPAQVVAAVVPPPPPAAPVLQFGEASWVKEIKTTTHNTNKVELAELVADDEGQPQPWANGEPAEVEVEWRLLQTEFAAADGGPNGELQGAPEELPEGDEVITRRYEFYKYIGPVDGESGEAMADAVGVADPDGVHFFGDGVVAYNDYIDPASGEWVTATVDLSTVWVVGEFFGAQMSAFDVAPIMGMIDHLQDGEVNVAYPDRTVVVAGGAAFLASIKSGSLPNGLNLDGVAGVISGTPTTAGVFTFTVEAADTTGALLSREFTVTIAAGEVVPTFSVAAGASPANGGSTSGGGDYADGANATVVATQNAGFAFVNWTEDGVVVSVSASYSFAVHGNRSLVANFSPVNRPPVADAQIVTTAEDTDLSIVLTATDADGDNLSYVVVESPVNGTLTGVAPNLTYHPDPNYNGADFLTFKANDGQADGNTATVSIGVTPANDAPVADAGADQAVRFHDVVVLDGSGSSDVDGDALTYAWTILSKPAHSKATLSNAADPGPTFKADKPGTYVLSLVVHDGTASSAADNVVTVATKK